jgi:hypothetical protein
MLRIVAFGRAIVSTSPRSSPEMRVTSAASIATSVLVPIAMPTSARGPPPSDQIRHHDATRGPSLRLDDLG